MANHEVQITADNFNKVVRPLLAELAGKAIMSGYPNLSARIGEWAKQLGVLAKTGEQSAVSTQAYVIAGVALGRALVKQGVAVSSGDFLIVIIERPSGVPSDKLPPSVEYPWERTPPKYGSGLPVTVTLPFVRPSEYFACFS